MRSLNMRKDKPQCYSTSDVVHISIVEYEVLRGFKPGYFVLQSGHEDVLKPEEAIEKSIAEVVS